MSGEAAVAAARLHELRWPLEPPLDLAGRTIAERRYVVLELVAADGKVGTAYCLTRGAPVFELLEGWLAVLLGRGAEELIAFAAAKAPETDDGPDPLPALRAQALVDICAWDLRTQAREMPLWRYLTPSPLPQTALIVDGYSKPGEDDAALAARLAATAAAGAKTIKIAADANPAKTERLLARLRSAAGAGIGLVVDMECEATDPAAALAAAQAWAPHQLAWIEDPFSPEQTAAIKAVRAASPIPVGAGDEGSVAQLRRLRQKDAVDVLRLDATTAGGISGVLGLLREASPTPVSFHVYPEVHRHLAFAFGAFGGIELFRPGGSFDFVDRFIAVELGLDRDGRLAPPTEPGLGISFLAAACAGHVTRAAVR